MKSYFLDPSKQACYAPVGEDDHGENDESGTEAPVHKAVPVVAVGPLPLAVDQDVAKVKAAVKYGRGASKEGLLKGQVALKKAKLHHAEQGNDQVEPEI